MSQTSRYDKAAFLCIPGLLLQAVYTWAYWVWHWLLYTLPLVTFLPPPLVIEFEVLVLYPYFLFVDVYVPCWIFKVLWDRRG